MAVRLRRPDVPVFWPEMGEVGIEAELKVLEDDDDVDIEGGEKGLEEETLQERVRVGPRREDGQWPDLVRASVRPVLVFKTGKLPESQEEGAHGARKAQDVRDFMLEMQNQKKKRTGAKDDGRLADFADGW